MVRLKGLAEKLRGGLGILCSTQHELDGVPLGIDRTVQVVPLLLDLDIGLIHAVGVIGRFELWPAAFVELRSIPLDPMKYRRMINRDPAFPQEFFHVARAQRIAEIPPHGAEDDVGLKVAPFE
jgi:hypothetical protein